VVVYPDTSFIVSLYGHDANNERAARIAVSLGCALAFTALQRHETRNAFRLAVFRGDITPDQCRAALANVEGDISNGVLLETTVAWADVFSTAEAVGAAHTELLGVRAIDILHVAAACAMGANQFLTFDDRQKKLAGRAGLSVKP